MSGLIYKKMSQVMSEIGHVGKDQKNTAQGFKFRGIDQFVNALYPALVKHEVFMTPRCVSERSELREITRSSGKQGVDKYVTILMEYDFFAEDGSKVTIGPIPAEGVDSGDKATNKALSAGLKYALIQGFCVPTEDMAEADKESPEHGVSIRSKVVDGIIHDPSANAKGEVKVQGPQNSGQISVEQAGKIQQAVLSAGPQVSAPSPGAIQAASNKKSFRKPVQQPSSDEL